MDTLLFGLGVAAVGILIVFFGLVILIGLIKVIVMATTEKAEKKKTEAPAPVAAPAPAPVAVEAAAPETDDALIAVITAAIAAAMENGAAFTVRRVRRISNTPAWQKAGREEQTYSRF